MRELDATWRHDGAIVEEFGTDAAAALERDCHYHGKKQFTKSWRSQRKPVELRSAIEFR